MNEREQVLKFLYETVTNTRIPIETRLKASETYLHHQIDQTTQTTTQMSDADAQKIVDALGPEKALELFPYEPFPYAR